MTDPTGPLSQLMIDNADTIDKAVETYGPSAVAEFFVNVGTGIAAAYELGNITDEVPALPSETEGN